MSVYSGIGLMTDSGDTVLLKYIESMCFREDADMIIDKLKGDITLSIRTISGKEHIVSMNALRATIVETTDNISLAQAIFDKWMWIHKP